MGEYEAFCEQVKRAHCTDPNTDAPDLDEILRTVPTLDELKASAGETVLVRGDAIPSAPSRRDGRNRVWLYVAFPSTRCG